MAHAGRLHVVGGRRFQHDRPDTDLDGLPDKLEDISGLKDPNGEPLPDFRAMGASPTRRDLFVEVGAMWAEPGTAYGTGSAVEVDGSGHNHLPTPAVLKMVGDAFKNAPVDQSGRLDRHQGALRRRAGLSRRWPCVLVDRG